MQEEWILYHKLRLPDCRTLVTYQTFDCLIKVKTEFLNKSQETYNENEDIAVMMFDISHGYIRLDIVCISMIIE